jgi:hypothetical protein
MVFADDTKLCTELQDGCVSSVELQSCLEAIIEWAKIWLLKLAPAKCTVMRIRSGHSLKCSPRYHIGVARLPVVASCTDLGVLRHSMIGYHFHCMFAKLLTKELCRVKLILKCFRSRYYQLLLRALCTFVTC